MKVIAIGKRYITAMVLAYLFVFLFSSTVMADSERTQEIINDIEHFAKQGMNGFEKVLKTKSMEKKDTITIWEELNEKHITRFRRITHIEFESTLKGQRDAQAAKAREWAENITAFFDDIQSCGTVAEWQRRVNIEISSLESDTEQAPKWIESNMSRAKKHSDYLTAVVRDLKSGSLSSADIQKRLDEIKNIRSEMENISSSLVSRVKYFEEDYALKSEMDKRIVAIINDWSNIKAKHPGVSSDLTDIPPTWVPLVKKHWEGFTDTKEKFDEAYGPLIEGNFFKDVAFFKDKKYSDLTKPVIEVEMDLKTQLVAKKQKEKSEEQLRKEIELDEELTKKERQRLLEIARATSPEKERELKLACARAAGGATGARELVLIMARNPEGSSEYRNAAEKLNLIDRNLHPEQIAAAKALREFYEEEKRLDPEYRQIIKEHTDRRRKLGLRPEFGN